MRISLANIAGDIKTIEVPASTTIAELSARVAALFAPQALVNVRLALNGTPLADQAATLQTAGVHQDDMLFVQIEAAVAPPAPVQPAAMGAQAAGASPAIPPGFVEAMQGRLAGMHRQQAIDENLRLAMEHTPEAFGRVVMLYVRGEVNNVPVTPFIDSGAQVTIMSRSLAVKCGLEPLIDTRFAGVAVGVGTAKILGRIHAAQLRLGDNLFLMCSFTVIDDTPADDAPKGSQQRHSVDLLFGLDMLMRHRACIDLEAHALRIQDINIPFLPEHELPASARGLDVPAEEKETAASSSSATAAAPPAPAPASAAPAPPTAVPPPQAARSSPAPPPVNVSEEAIQQLEALGASRDMARQLLIHTRGNVELAAALLFQ
ncbi:DNA damage-inducible protein 1 [Allomyces javanicus]|nr:DNA damage-inducible protein 1 [Allomyces javanicus]